MTPPAPKSVPEHRHRHRSAVPASPVRRHTRQRATIHQVIAGAGRPLTVHEILSAATALLPGMGMATVYRTLKSLIAEGAVREVQLPAAAVRYEPAGLAHHHHFHCRDCDKVFEMEGCVDLRHLTPPGFTMDDHELLVLGRCDRCQRAFLRRRPPAE